MYTCLHPVDPPHVVWQVSDEHGVGATLCAPHSPLQAVTVLWVWHIRVDTRFIIQKF